MHAGARRLRAGGDDSRASALPPDGDHLRLGRRAHRARPAQGLRVRRRRLRAGAGRAGDPARQGQRLRRAATGRRAQLERLNRRSRTARRRAHGRARGSRAAGRTSSSRCSRTSCAIRWRRSGSAAQLVGLPDAAARAARASRRPSFSGRSRTSSGSIDDLVDVSRITRGTHQPAPRADSRFRRSSRRRSSRAGRSSTHVNTTRSTVTCPTTTR